MYYTCKDNDNTTHKFSIEYVENIGSMMIIEYVSLTGKKGSPNSIWVWHEKKIELDAVTIENEARKYLTDKKYYDIQVHENNVVEKNNKLVSPAVISKNAKNRCDGVVAMNDGDKIKAIEALLEKSENCQ